jgi:hypothetical protein
MMTYFLIIGFFAIVGFIVQNRLKSKFNKYSKQALHAGMSGREVAEDMLRHYGITDVKVTQGQGYLSDHYHPGKKTVNLSPQVYQGRSIAAAAVAAHECGHAVQHATSYSWLEMRSTLVPVVSFASNAQQWLLLLAIGGLGGGFQAGSTILLLTVIAFGLTTLFSLVTLPVEFDATERGLVWLKESGVTGNQKEYDGAKDALNWAAMTYVVAALSSLAMTAWLLLRFLGND